MHRRGLRRRADTIIGVKSHAPLIVAYGGAGSTCSPPTSWPWSARQSASPIWMTARIAVVRTGSVEFFTPFLDRVEKEIKTVDWDISAADKGGI